MPLTSDQQRFIEEHAAAAMITLGDDGRPKAARVGIALIDGRLLSSGTTDRVRTKRLRQNPECTIFVFEMGFRWLTLEATVAILEGPDSIDTTVALFRAMQNRPTGSLNWCGGELDEDLFRAQMDQEGRLLYEFEVTKAYGSP